MRLQQPSEQFLEQQRLPRSWKVHQAYLKEEAILFGLSLFLSPIFLAIPSFATAPALIVVGFYMLTNVAHVDFDDFSEALPCYICILAMPFFYSISEGISMGVISYVILNLMTGKAKEKKISALMYVLAVLFILKYIFL